jgi:hypothetical protein
MKRMLRFAPSPAMVVSCIALLVALGGVGYAATALPRNSVGPPQIKRNAVTSIKVKDRSLLARDFRRGQLPRGPRGLTGAAGAAGAKGDKGDKGDKGEDFLHDSVLKPGATITGTFGASSGDSGWAFTEVDFHPRLPADVPAANAHYVTGASAANCPGNSQAAPGHLCVYQRHSASVAFQCFCDPYSAAAGIRTIGVVLFWSVSAASNHVRGNWAYTAPTAAAAAGAPGSTSSGTALP